MCSTLLCWITLFLCMLSVLLAAEHEDSPVVKVVHGVLDNCLSREKIGDCFQDEAANALGRALKSTNSITLAPGVVLQRKPEETMDFPNSIASSEGKQLSGYGRFWDNLQKFLSSWSLNVQLPDSQEEEGRGKKKKVFKYVAVAAATAAAILVPVKLKLIAWMAASALLIGKIALLLASLVGLKTLVTKPQEETTHVHYDAHRSDQGHYLAYGGYGYDLPPGNSIDYNQ